MPIDFNDKNTDQQTTSANPTPTGIEWLVGLHILVVDDEKDIALNTQVYLSRYGASVDIATDAPAAWNMIRKGKYNLVLTDFSMPDYDGAWLAFQIKNNVYTWHIPVVFITGHGMQNKVAAISNGGALFIEKPLELAQLLTLGIVLDDDMKKHVINPDDQR